MLDAIWQEASKFENVLQSLRVRRGKSWTQKETAKLLGVEYRLYVGWENGEGVPSPENLRKIVAVFGLNQEEEEMLCRAAMQIPQKIKHLPFPPNPFFTGRKSYLERLRQFFQENGTLALTQPVSISGLGGIGKTQLALAYAYLSHPKVYRVVLWVNAVDSMTLQADYVKLAPKLNLPETDIRDPEQCIQAVKQWLDDHTHWLLIMDNADDLQLAHAFFPKSKHGHILLTTRSPFAGNIGARQIEVDKMAPDEGLVFLLRRTRKLEVDAPLDTVAADIRKPAAQLVNMLDGHPLALDQAGAFIEQTRVSFTEYIDLYNQQCRRFLDTYGALGGANSEHPDTFAVTFELCFEQARKLHPLSTDILNFCAFLMPDAIPEELFQHDDGFKVDALEFNKAIAALLRYSLIKRNTQENTLSIHRLVQSLLEFALFDLYPDLMKRWRTRVISALLAAYPATDFVEWARGGLQYVLCCTFCTTPDEHYTSLHASLLSRTGLPLYDLMQYPQASSDSEEIYLQRAIFILEKEVGLEHPAIGMLLDMLGSVHFARGEYERAEPLLSRAVLIREKYLGADHLDIADSMFFLADIYHREGKYEQSELLFQRVLNIKAQRLGPTHPGTQGAKREYANFLHDIGRHADAAALEVNIEPSE